jgi:hypothetical protein
VGLEALARTKRQRALPILTLRWRFVILYSSTSTTFTYACGFTGLHRQQRPGCRTRCLRIDITIISLLFVVFLPLLRNAVVLSISPIHIASPPKPISIALRCPILPHLMSTDSIVCTFPIVSPLRCSKLIGLWVIVIHVGYLQYLSACLSF